MADLAPPDRPFAYDLFVSYRRMAPDGPWVRNVLVPRLEVLGLKVCIDQRDFSPGVYLIKEMERAVVQSRFTLAVLSPEYLESGYTELEHVLSRQLGLEDRRNRFLAVLRRPCEPGLDLRARLWIDMTDDGEFDERVVRLVQAVRPMAGPESGEKVPKP
jgi:hypothetical protein